MDFNKIKRWMDKMNNILELYGKDESFTQSEKNLLLDYNQKIREAISELQVEDSEPIEMIHTQNPIRKTEEIKIIKPVEKQEPVVKEAIPVKSDAHADSDSDSEKYQELFLFKMAGDLSEKLESTPIDNIQKALGLNQRIVTQNDLFAGDKNSFDTAVKRLNSMNHFREAKEFLCEEIIPEYDWTHKDRIKKAQEFIKLVKRKYS
jgi:hypothetical protein